MLEFTKTAFRGFMSVILWVNLILFTIGGGVGGYFIGYAINRRDDVPVGIFLGIIVGIITNIIFGGFTATIINIDKNVEMQNKILKKMVK